MNISIKIPTAKGIVPGILYSVEQAQGALIMVGGARGGTLGPGGIYEELARHMQEEGCVALRLDYRTPNILSPCIEDVLAAVDILKHLGVIRLVLLGWSFGGAVVISSGALSDAVVGVATVASQTSGTDSVRQLSPKSLLLIHGTADHVLPDLGSRRLYNQAGEPKELLLYPSDDHSITFHRSELLKKLYSWSKSLLLLQPGDTLSPQEK